jgi:hypothetical protein
MSWANSSSPSCSVRPNRACPVWPERPLRPSMEVCASVAIYRPNFTNFTNVWHKKSGFYLVRVCDRQRFGQSFIVTIKFCWVFFQKFPRASSGNPWQPLLCVAFQKLLSAAYKIKLAKPLCHLLPEGGQPFQRAAIEHHKSAQTNKGISILHGVLFFSNIPSLSCL